MKLQYKLALGLFVVTLLPLVSLVIAIYVFNQSQVQRIADVSRWQVQSVLKSVESGLVNAQSKVSPWALSSDLTQAAVDAGNQSRESLESLWKSGKYLYNPTAEYLKRLNFLSNDQYQEIFLTDERGYVVASTNPTSDFGQGPEDDPPDGELWWAQARQLGSYIGELEYDQSVGAHSMDIALNLLHDDRFVGVLKAVFNVESILDLVGEGEVGRSGHSVLVNREGTVIAAPRRFRAIVFNEDMGVGDLEIFTAIQKNQPAFTIEEVPWIGEAFVSTLPSTSFKNLHSRGWNGLVIIPLEQALVPVREVEKISILSLILILLALGLFTSLVSRRLSRPLAEITAAVSEIEGGHLDIKVPHGDGSDEVGRLARNINRMTERLARYDNMNIDRIQSLNEELAAANQELTVLASRDGLTGLWNARMFQERLDQELKRNARTGSPVSLLLADVDHFKQVNDTYGHQAGDEVLRRLGTLLNDISRKTDIPARYGGEELAVILTDTNHDGAMKVAEKIRRLIALEEYDTDSVSFHVTASIGVAEYRRVEGIADPRAYLVKLADEALYRAKKGGRNRVEPAIYDGTDAQL